MAKKGSRHRATLKQENKRHKKPGLGSRTQKKGRVNSVNVKVNSTRVTFKQLSQSRWDLKANKVNQLKLQEKLFKNGYRGVTKIIPVIPLCSVNDSFQLVEKLFQSSHNDFETKLNLSQSSYTLTEPTSKVRLQFIPLARDFFHCMDVCKVADNVIFLLSGSCEVDKFGETLLTALQAQGIPNSFTIAQDMDKFGIDDTVKKSLTSFMSYFFPENAKILTHQPDELNKVMRTIASSPTKHLSWRENRPYMYADNYEYRPTDPSNGTLVVRGYLRGANINPNRLVHLHDLGDFQLQQVTAAPLPTSTEARVLYNSSNGKPFQVVANSEEQDNLNPYNSGDEHMDGEEFSEDGDGPMDLAEEMQDHDTVDLSTSSRSQPKVTSKYQQAWLPSDEELDENEEEDEFSTSMFQFKGRIQGNQNDDQMEPEALDQGNESEERPESVQGEDADLINLEHDPVAYQQFLNERNRQVTDQQLFPDEMDTPIDQPARQRFVKYRGLERPRVTYWDPYEELPEEYSKLHQFKNFKQMQQHILEANLVEQNSLEEQWNDAARDQEASLEELNSRVRVGTYVDVHIPNVPSTFLELYPNRPLTLFFLFQLENKVTVLNSLVNRYTEFKEPIQSKDPLIFQLGFRRYKVSPLFSQHARKTKAPNNVYKFSKFLLHHEPSTVTFYGPITFNPTHVLTFKPNSIGHLEATTPPTPNLVAYGQFKDCDVTRIITKRIILTGHPLRINRRSAVIRYMFFNDLDVAHFKPVQLHTKFGLLGHIADSIGTHGLMKCRFNGQLKQHDTITLNLYKRVFPKSFAKVAEPKDFFPST